MQSLKGLSKPVGIHSNKYSRGSVLIIGGSEKFSGAMFMASFAAENAMAALRTGTGYVTIAAPEPIINLASRISPVFILRKLTGNTAKDLKTIASVRHNVLVLGPGLDGSEKPQFLKSVLKAEGDKAIVVDGAMLHFLKGNKKLIGSNMILTPHDGEFGMLTGESLEGKSPDARLRAVKDFMRGSKCTLVLKGHETIIAKGRKIKVNRSRTPALATMGTGDVLCGMIAAYAASGLGSFESAFAAVRAHSMIGDALYRKKGMHIIATDVIEAIPDVLKRFDKIDKAR
jgi:hydroxyethylthiazole kinase-like uncharacterized protein yjeF